MWNKWRWTSCQSALAPREMAAFATMARWCVLPVLTVLTLFCAIPALAQTSEAPPGWSIETGNADGVAYRAPNSEGAIFIRVIETVNGKPTPEADKILTEFLVRACPNAKIQTPQSLLGGRASRVQAVLPSHICSLTLAEKDGRLLFIGAIGLADGRVDQLALGILEKRLTSAPPAVSAITPTKSGTKSAALPPNAKAQGGSVQSAGTQGVFIAIGPRTVYDPVLAVRIEIGLHYLILTKGGYFLTDVPKNGGFDDASAQRHFAEYPNDGGTFTVSGNQIALRFANGKTAQAVRRGGNIIYDDQDYAPKRYFPDGATLSGAYTAESVTQYGPGGFAVGNNDYDFSPDGRFGHGRQVSVANTGFTIRGGKEGRGGTYRIANSALYLTYDDGERRVLSLWAEKPDDAIWFDGEMFKRPWDK
jgi:uncharacterized protein YciI